MKRAAALSPRSPSSSRPVTPVRSVGPAAAEAPALGASGPAVPTSLGAPSQASDGPAASGPLRIQEASELVGLTPRSIRYYEEMGLLRPSGRSQGAYRLYDESDIERLRFIKGLRDDAGFSLAEIGRILEAESERARAREAFRATEDPRERRSILTASIARIDEQVDTLQAKIDRLQGMVDDAQRRRARHETLLAGLDDER